MIVVWARTEEGEVNGFLVSGTEPGLKATEITGKASVRAVLQADIQLENVRLPAEARLPRAESFRDTSRVLAATRNACAWSALGRAVGAYEAPLAYAVSEFSSASR